MFTNELEILIIGSLATIRGSIVWPEANLECFMYNHVNMRFLILNITNLGLLTQYFSLEIVVTFGTDSLNATQNHSELDELLCPLR